MKSKKISNHIEDDIMNWSKGAIVNPGTKISSDNEEEMPSEDSLNKHIDFITAGLIEGIEEQSLTKKSTAARVYYLDEKIKNLRGSLEFLASLEIPTGVEINPGPPLMKIAFNAAIDNIDNMKAFSACASAIGSKLSAFNNFNSITQGIAFQRAIERCHDLKENNQTSEDFKRSSSSKKQKKLSAKTVLILCEVLEISIDNNPNSAGSKEIKKLFGWNQPALYIEKSKIKSNSAIDHVTNSMKRNGYKMNILKKVTTYLKTVNRINDKTIIKKMYPLIKCLKKEAPYDILNDWCEAVDKTKE
jgi:hypothetical protein